MDQRFTRAWDDLDRARTRVGSFSKAIKGAPSRDLIAALAGVGSQDSVAANVLATELLNRQARAPFLGAFLVSATVFAAIFILDLVYTGTALILESGERGYVLAALTATSAVSSLFLFLVWKGRIRPPRLKAGSPPSY